MKSLNHAATALLALTAFLSPLAARAATLSPTDPQPGGIGYSYTVHMGAGGDEAIFSNHVGAWSWEDNSLFGNPGQGTEPVGWTHTSRWVALSLQKPVLLTVKLERDATVPWPSGTDPNRLADTSSMFPSFTLWDGWQQEGTDSHTYNNRGNVSWAPSLTYRDHLDNSTETTVTRTYLLPAGLYTLALGSNAPANNTNRQGFKCTLTTATQLPVDLFAGGVGYAHTIVTDGTDTGTFSNHVGAWSWEDNALFGNPGQGTEPVGWTHTSRWVALRLTRSAFFTLTMERDATVPWPSAQAPDRLADTSSMFPSFTIWNGWHNTGTDSHTYNNRGNVSWASGLTYRDHLDNSTQTTITRTYLLPAGDYTLALGSNAPANNNNRQGFRVTFAATRAGALDPVPNTYPEGAAATGGVGYARTVIAGSGDNGSFSEHVGAWSWEDNALFGNPGQGTQPVGWTHTSKWLAVRLEDTAFFTVTMARDANVPWPSGSNPDRLADTSSMFPSLTLWRGWQNSGSDSHTYNNRGRVAWAPDLAYLDHIDNSTQTVIARTWRLPPGDYTLALGSNAPATNPNRQGFRLTYDVRRALPGDTHGDPVPNTYPQDAPSTGGIGYSQVIVARPSGLTRTFSDHVGAWSWEDNALFDASAGEPPVGWTHTSRWVALFLPVTMTIDLTLARDANVPWPSPQNPDRKADTSSMFPSLTLWRGWDNDGSDDHTYNNRGNVAWAEDLTYLDHVDNSTEPTLTRSWTLPAGFYTLAIGSNAPATNSLRQGFRCTLEGRPPVPSAPRITAQPVSSTVVEGRPCRMSVTATGPELEYQWFKDGVILRGATSRTLEVAS
ncbi:MAG: immunoglobulin domain-containing protein, partial [Prosthecobacter sp.]|nr:immunoglobulin domain-containing protein [Prosthecobacter sp.]